MARLPQPGSDGGVWGDLLNEYLLQIHKSDGTLRDNVVTATSLAPGAVQASNLLNLSGATNGQVLTLDSSAPGGYRWSSVTGGGTQVNADWNAASGAAQILNKPTLGTAASANVTAFATAAQGAKADTAVQPGSLATVATTGSYTDLTNKPTIPTTLGSLTNVNASAPANGQVLAYDNASGKWIASTVTSTTVSDATTGVKGIVQLAGDLGGTAGSPSVLKFNGVTLPTAAPTNGQALLATSGTAASWQTLAGVATTGDYASLINKPTIPAAQVQTDWNATTGLASIANKPALASVATSGSYTDLTGKPALATVATSGSYDDLTNKPTVPTVVDASTTAKGIVQLAGDLGGTATSPSVLAARGVAFPSAIPVYGQILVAISATQMGWTAPGLSKLADVNLATAPTNGQVLSYDTATSKWIPSTVTSTTVTDASTTAKGIVQLAGDLGGTAASPSVLKFNGITLPSSAPSAGQILTASSSTVAAWGTAPVTSVAGRTGDVVLTKTDVGLANVDNTADTAKAFSAIQITSGTLDPARVVVGGVMYTSGTTRPTTRTDIMVIFTGATDPGANANAGDMWVGS